jgi:Trk K+ transport system NAD-binding subunit
VGGGSEIAGRTLGELYKELSQYDFEVIAIMRREHVLLPHRNTVLLERDRLVLIASLQAREPLGRFIDPIPDEQRSGVQLEAAEQARDTG